MEKVLHWKNLVRCLILLFWGVLLLGFFFSGKINLYLKKQYAPLVLVAGGFFLLIALFSLKRMKLVCPERAVSAAVSGEVSFEEALAYSLFIFPLLLAILVNPGALNSFAAGKRGTMFDYSLGRTELLRQLQEAAEVEARYEKRNLLFVSSLTRNFPEKAEGKGISTVGFVYRNGSMKANQFALIRFLITCCAADAQPLGILVESDAAEDLTNDQWVEANGFLTRREEKGKSLFLLSAEEVLPIEEPDEPYLY